MADKNHVLRHGFTQPTWAEPALILPFSADCFFTHFRRSLPVSGCSVCLSVAYYLTPNVVTALLRLPCFSGLDLIRRGVKLAVFPSRLDCVISVVRGAHFWLARSRRRLHAC